MKTFFLGCDHDFLRKCITDFNSSIELITEENDEYSEFHKPFCLRHTEKPIAYLIPSNLHDVQIVVRCLKRSKCEFTIKSGGHSYENYSYRSEYVIDLINLNDINVDKNKMTATIGAGVKMGEAVKRLHQQFQVMIAAGNVPTVGVSGYALGGGWGLLSRKYGLLMQTIVEMTVVDANGDVLIANEFENSDLFRALRGAGGGNFGVVTELKFKAFHIRHELHFHQFQFKVDDFEEFFDKYQTLVENSDKSITALGCLTRDYLVLLAVVDNENIVEREHLSNWLKTHFHFGDSVKHNLISANFSEIQRILKAGNEKFHHMVKTKSFYVDRQLTKPEVKKLFQISKNILRHSENLLLFFVQLGGEIINIRKKSSFIHDKNPFFIELELYNELEFADLPRKFTQLTKFIDSGYTYPNAIDEDEDLTRFYGYALPFLMHVKCKYDATNLFRFKQSIPLPRYCKIDDSKPYNGHCTAMNVNEIFMLL